MNKFLTIIIVLIALVAFSTTVALAEDLKLEKKIERVTLKKDKNNNPFAILIVKDTKSLDGVTYTGDVPVFAFGDQYGQVKNLKRGDTLKAIVAKRSYNGNQNYQILTTY